MAAIASLEKLEPWSKYREVLKMADTAIQSGIYSEARTLLELCPNQLRDWEWDYLMGTTKDGIKSIVDCELVPMANRQYVGAGQLEYSPGNLRFSTDGQLLAILMNAGRVVVVDASSGVSTRETTLQVSNGPVRANRGRGRPLAYFH